MKRIFIYIIFLWSICTLSGCGLFSHQAKVNVIEEVSNETAETLIHIEQTGKVKDEKETGQETISEDKTVSIDRDTRSVIREDIIDTNEIYNRGGIIEFAGEMTYKEFEELCWVDMTDNSLPEDTKLYVVKIHYPDGFEHVRGGFIENCMATGIYDAVTGEYLGGSFETVED